MRMLLRAGTTSLRKSKCDKQCETSKFYGDKSIVSKSVDFLHEKIKLIKIYKDVTVLLWLCKYF